MGSIIFSVPGHVEKIKAGVKTQTRRVPRPNDHLENGVLYKGKQTWYAVGHESGIRGERNGKLIGYILIADLSLEDVTPTSYISEADAWAEGGYTPEQYENVWRDLNPKLAGTFYQRLKITFHWTGDGLVYTEFQKKYNVPLCKRSAIVNTEMGQGIVRGVNLKKGSMKVLFPNIKGTYWFLPDEVKFTREVF